MIVCSATPGQGTRRRNGKNTASPATTRRHLRPGSGQQEGDPRACRCKAGYSPEKVLMIGDAPGDMAAARGDGAPYLSRSIQATKTRAGSGFSRRPATVFEPALRRPLRSATHRRVRIYLRTPPWKKSCTPREQDHSGDGGVRARAGSQIHTAARIPPSRGVYPRGLLIPDAPPEDSRRTAGLNPGLVNRSLIRSSTIQNPKASPMPQHDIGLVGLAVMGQNLVLNMANHGFSVGVFNRTTSKTDEFVDGPGQRQSRSRAITRCASSSAISRRRGRS